MVEVFLSWSILQLPWYQLDGLAAHGIILHFFFLVSFFGQALPPNLGSARIVLCMETQPRPHDAEQGDHSDHSETWQSLCLGPVCTGCCGCSDM